MKPRLVQQPHRRTAPDFEAGNEALRLAAEVLEFDGDLPAIDIPGATMDHWNGQKLSLARSDIADLMTRGLIDRDGRWTDQGRALVLFGLERHDEALRWVRRARRAAK